MIDFLSFLHHIQEDRTLWHGDVGEKCFIDLHSVVDWDRCGWNGRFLRYRLMKRDVKVTWQRQESRKELLFGTIKIMLEFAHLFNFYAQTPVLCAEGICYRRSGVNEGTEFSCDESRNENQMLTSLWMLMLSLTLSCLNISVAPFLISQGGSWVFPFCTPYNNASPFCLFIS